MKLKGGQVRKTIKVIQLDLTLKDNMINILKEYQSKSFLIIGVEVTDLDCANICHVNIDPQHGFAPDTNITSVELMYRQIDKIKDISNAFEGVLFTTIKPDLDSISAITLAMFYLANKEFALKNNDTMLRLIAIANSDRHESTQTWSKRKPANYFGERHLFSRHGLPVGLLAAIGDISKGIDYKVTIMSSYLRTGSFKEIDRYVDIVSKKNKINSQYTNITVIIDGIVVFIESNFRGALGLGYKHAPIVIAKNPSFTFGNRIKGTKYTIAQFNSGHIDLEKLAITLNEIEPGWGGNMKSILGSPQSAPTKIKESQLIQIVKDQLI